MSQLDYRLLEFQEPLNAAAQAAFVQSQAEMMAGWRHVGIVPLTIDQATSALHAAGRAVRDAPRAAGTFPVVMLMGGTWYLSTTAEILASNGYLVIAPVRPQDDASEIPTMEFPWFVEKELGDAQWALSTVEHDPSADLSRVTALGHGAGGLMALLLCMRDRRIGAVVNIDAGNFSRRTNPRQLAFYHPRLLRAPYLYLARSETRRESDLFSEFENMRFSRRYEVILEDGRIRHHDLSDAGRAVSAPLGLRGEEASAVLRAYASVQDALLRFLAGGDPWQAWMRQYSGDPAWRVRAYDAVAPAPLTADVLTTLSEDTPAELAEARRRDPDAPVFNEDEIERILGDAKIAERPAVRTRLARLALEIHPKSVTVSDQAAAAFESAGDMAAAREANSRCLAVEASYWRAQIAQCHCRQRVERLR
jgi:hypothetical protein